MKEHPAGEVYLSPRQVLGIYLSQDGLCVYCDRDLTPETLTTEHVICRLWGGPVRALWNLALACEDCNKLKGTLEGGFSLHVSEWGVTMDDRLEAAWKSMLREAGGNPAVQRMVVEIKKRLSEADSYRHPFVPSSESSEGASGGDKEETS